MCQSEIKRYHVNRWLNGLSEGGICKVGHSRNPWWQNMKEPRSATVPKWIKKKVNFELEVLRLKARVFSALVNLKTSYLLRLSAYQISLSSMESMRRFVA